MELRETKRIEFTGCFSTDEFYKKLLAITEDMKKNAAPYSGSFELEVSLNGGMVSTETKHSAGLSDSALRMFDELESISTTIAKGGREPSKVNAEIQIEKEL